MMRGPMKAWERLVVWWLLHTNSRYRAQVRIVTHDIAKLPIKLVRRDGKDTPS